MKDSSSVVREFESLSPEREWSFQEVGRSDTTAYTHSYHRYPAKFIPQIVQKLIREFAPSNTEVVCDPFGGCGTTLVESKLLGHRSIGFDINPVAKFITQAKTTAIRPTRLTNARERFLDIYADVAPRWTNHHVRIHYWFDTPTIQELDKIYFAIQSLKDLNVRRFFLCSFSHILKNCSRWLMKSIKPTVDKNKEIPVPLEIFLSHLDSMIKKNELFYTTLNKEGFLEVPARMYRRDSTTKLPIDSNSTDIIITSPPYVTSYEYADLHQLSLLWFGDDPINFRQWNRFTRESFEFRKSFIGTSLKQKKYGNYESNLGAEIVSALERIEKAVSSDVANYFRDMQKAFVQMYRVLKPGGKACVIVGNTNLRGVEILNAQVAAEQMLSTGFQRVEFIKREISNKMITPWRDVKTGKFTSKDSPTKIRAYEFEYLLIMEKSS